jgi:hypothetical protein
VVIGTDYIEEEFCVELFVMDDQDENSIVSP